MCHQEKQSDIGLYTLIGSLKKDLLLIALKKSLLNDPRLFKSTFTLGRSFWDRELFTMLITVPWWVPYETSTTRSQSILTSLIVKILSYLIDIQLGMSWFSWNSHFVGPKPMNFWRMLWLFINSSLFSANAPYRSLYMWLLQIWLLYTCSNYQELAALQLPIVVIWMKACKIPSIQLLKNVEFEL